MLLFSIICSLFFLICSLFFLICSLFVLICPLFSLFVPSFSLFVPYLSLFVLICSLFFRSLELEFAKSCNKQIPNYIHSHIYDDLLITGLNLGSPKPANPYLSVFEGFRSVISRSFSAYKLS